VSDSVPGGSSPFEQPDFSGIEEDADSFEDEDESFEEEAFEDADEVDADDADDELEAEPDGNSVDVNVSGTSRALSVLEHIAVSIVDDKDAVTVESKEVRGQDRLYLHVAPSDMGRIIGRRGRTAQAVRTLVRAAAAGEGNDVFVEIVD
jgi:predicted RNA-binding protein YlqC (UPF0109 family)